MSPAWWTLPGCSSCPVDAAARAEWQDGITACNRRRALQIRRYDPPRSSLLVVVGSEGTPDQSGRTIPKPHGRIDSRSPAGTAAIIAGLFYSRYVRPHRIRPFRRFSTPLQLETAEPGRGWSGHR
jgi:hypothetical protein